MCVYVYKYVRIEFVCICEWMFYFSTVVIAHFVKTINLEINERLNFLFFYLELVTERIK